MVYGTLLEIILVPIKDCYSTFLNKITKYNRRRRKLNMVLKITNP